MGPLGVDLCFGTYCLVVGAVRLRVLASPGAPAGVDGGNWLALGRALFGNPVRPWSNVYPPVVPALVTGAVQLWGPVTGIAGVAVLSSLLPAVAAYVALRCAGLGWTAALLGGLLVPAASTGEATAWGGYPQLLATGLIVLFLWMLDRCLVDGRPWGALATGAVLALSLATSHFIGVIGVLAGLVLIGLHIREHRRGDGRRPISLGLVLVAAPSLPLLPLYLTLATTILPGFTSRAGSARVSIGGVVPQVEYICRDFRWFWGAAMAVAVVTPLLAGERRRHGLWRVPTALVTATAGTLIATGEPRTLYLLPPAAVMTLGFWAHQLHEAPAEVSRLAARGSLAVLVAAVAVQSVLGLRLFRDQAQYYRMLSPGLVDGIDWLRARTPRHALVAVTPINDAPLGWWVEGLGRRSALAGSDPNWLYNARERADAVEANRIFASPAPNGQGFPNDDSLTRAAAAGVEYAFVAKAWGGYVESTAERYLRLHPGELAFENDAVLVLRVPPSGLAASPVPSGSTGRAFGPGRSPAHP